MIINHCPSCRLTLNNIITHLTFVIYYAFIHFENPRVYRLSVLYIFVLALRPQIVKRSETGIQSNVCYSRGHYKVVNASFNSIFADVHIDYIHQILCTCQLNGKLALKVCYSALCCNAHWIESRP